MTINIALKVGENDAHKNGFVGYDENSIYRVLETDGEAYQERNGNRVKDIFDNKFTSTSSAALASSLHKGKSELSSSGNLFGTLDKLNSAVRLINRDQSNLLNDVLGVQSFEVKNETFELSRKILSDKTVQLSQEFGEEFGLESGADDAFNPDFPANSVSYTYSEPRVTIKDNRDKVGPSNKAPNVVFPNNEEVGKYVTPFKSSTSNGGFGNSASANSIGEDRLDSLRITTKY